MRGLALLGTSLEKAEDYPLDLSPYEDKTKVLVTCGTQVALGKRELARTTKHLAKDHQNVTFSSP